jgi:hypothetical protein
MNHNNASMQNLKRPGDKGAINFKNLSLNFLMISLLFGVNVLGELGNLISLSVLGAMALRSTSGALKALCMLGIIIMGNPFIAEKTIILTYFRFPLLALAGARILFDVFNRRPDIMRVSYLNGLLLFGLICVVLAPINGYFTGVAVLKAGLFTYGLYAILSGTLMGRSGGPDLTVWFIAMMAFIVIGTIITIPLGISHVFRGENIGMGGAGGLSGITTHQQTLGSFGAICAVFCFAVGVFGKIPHRWIPLTLFVLFLPIVWMTQSRTAFGTLVLSIFFVIAVAPFVLKGRISSFRRFNFAKWIAAIACFVVVGFALDLATGGRINEKLTGFAFKSRSTSFYDVRAMDMASSRMGLIERSWDIFMEHPMTGINFGTSLAPYFVMNATLLSAPTEKGFLPTAILEETGVVGTTFFLIFIFLALYRLYSDENIIGLSLFVAFLIQNLGEMMFFSLGGAGLFCWSIVAAGIAVGYSHQFRGRIQSA